MAFVLKEELNTIVNKIRVVLRHRNEFNKKTKTLKKNPKVLGMCRWNKINDEIDIKCSLNNLRLLCFTLALSALNELVLLLYMFYVNSINNNCPIQKINGITEID